jgi:serine/threonine-protein kinase
MKILRAGNPRDAAYRLDRFRDEIDFLRSNPDRKGVLPLIDSHVTTDPSKLNWYVMPKADPLRQALGDDPPIETVLQALAAFAETLADLADEGIGHRDIKPDNLFRLDNGWALGDFGLVAYPQKDPRTTHGRKLGPTDYMAPEMRQDADTARPGPADVWALAKTAWVLLTSASLPQPGPHRPADEAFSLRQRITFKFVDELDLLLERATHMDPGRRISMREFANELRACLLEPPEARTDSTLEDLQSRLHQLVAPHQQRKTDAQERLVVANNAFYELQAVQKATWNELSHLTRLNGPMGGPGPAATQMLGTPTSSPYAAYSSGGDLVSPDQEGRVRISVEVAMRIQGENGPARVAAIISVQHYFLHHAYVERVWELLRDVPVGSAQFANVVQEVAVGFKQSYAEVLKIAAQIMELPEDGVPAWWQADIH